MGLARGWAVSLTGITGRIVVVEADVGPGLPGFGLIGLPDTALSEARERVRAAVVNSGESWPGQKITVSLSPADLPKRGSGFDLALALVVLAGAGGLPADAAADTAILGELGLDGSVRPLRGVLPAVAAAARAGLTRILVPAANCAEAHLVAGIEVLGIQSLTHACALLRGDEQAHVEATVGPQPSIVAGAAGQLPDLAEVRGQQQARRAMEVAAVGGHHVFLHGGPGVGKTMLAERLPGLLPVLSGPDALAVTEIHSVAGYLSPDQPLIAVAPYCRPHHSATAAAMVGGGSKDIRPGAVSLAHRGVLFLDEATEFRPGVLDGLREPMESGEVVIARSGVVARLPAAFLLVLAANPCPCASPDPQSCRCRGEVRRRYLAKLSRPLLDRIDLQVLVDRPTRAELLDAPEGESSAVVAARVALARERSTRRLAACGWTHNAQVPGRLLRTGLRVGADGLALIESALDRDVLSPRGVDRVLRVAWSVADLGGRDRPGRAEIGEALALRIGAGGQWAA